jgi:serine phosphatase RsbU (regulator of sigma subunit)
MAGTLKGRAAVERAEQELFTIFPDMRLEQNELWLLGDRVVVTGAMSGTDRGGAITAPGTTVRFPVVLLHTIQAGHVVAERRIWDFSGFLLQRVQRDLKVAGEIQQMLFPRGHVVGEGFEVAASSVPCRSIGGDFFDYFDRPAGEFAWALGDVAGKGPPAALLGASLQAILGVCQSSEGPASVLTSANRAMLRRAIPSRFATVVFATLSADGHLTYCNAGHNPPLLVSREGHRWLRQGGTVLGMFENAAFEEETVRLARGDRLVAFSDGITEAVSADGTEFGEDRLLSTVRAGLDLSPAALVDRILETVQQFSKGTAQNDDLTVLVLTRT